MADEMVSFEQGGIYQMGHDCLFANGEDELRSANIPAVSMMVETNEPAPSIKASPRINKPAKDNSNLYKSTLCIHFSRHGSCNLGDGCTFAHGKDDLVNVIVPNNKDPKYKTKLCLRYAQDKFCPSGDNCVFAHDENELKELPEVGKKSRLFKTTLCHNFSTLGVCPSGKNCGFAHGRYELRPVGFEGDFEAKVAGNPKWKCSLCKIFIQSGFCNKPSCDFAHGNEELRVETPENPRIIRSNYKRVMCNNWASNGHCFHEDTCSFAHGEEELQKFSCSKDVASALKLFRGGPAGMRKRPTTAMSQTGMGGGHMGQPRFTSMNATAADQKLFAEFLEFKKFKEQTEGIKYMPGIGMQQTDARPAMTQFFNSFQAGNSMKRPVMPTVPLDPMVSRGSINVKSVPVGAGYLEGANSAGGLGRRINPRNGNRTTVTEMGNAMFNGVRNDAFVAAGVRRQEMEHAFAY